MSKYSYPGFEDKPKLSWRLIAGIAVASLALGWWYFRPEKPSVPTVDQAAPAASSSDSSTPVASTPAGDAYQTAGHDDLLALLRQKLSVSDAEALAALAEIAKDQPELAISLAHELGRTDAEKAGWVQQIVKQWAGRSPDQAWNWVSQPNNSLANLPLVGVVMDAMAANNPDALLGHMDALLLQDDKSGGLLSAQNTVYYGLEALIHSGNIETAQATVEAWANDPNKLPFGPAAYQIVAMAMDQNAPGAIGAWLRSMPVSDDRNSAIESFAYQWGQNNPVAAMSWAQNLAPQEGQTEAVGRVFSEWIQADPTKAMNWLEDYVSRTPDNIADDLMIGSMVLFSPSLKSDPGEALKLADSISDPQSRSTYQQQVIQSWARSDAAAAVEYLLNNQTIDPEQKKLLMQEVQDASSPNPPDQ